MKRAALGLLLLIGAPAIAVAKPYYNFFDLVKELSERS